MKKVLFVMILIFTLCGCRTKRENVIEEYAIDYYNNYGVKVSNEFVVTLEKLRESNENGVTNYNLDDYIKCDDLSEVLFIVENGKIKESKISLICEDI